MFLSNRLFWIRTLTLILYADGLNAFKLPHIVKRIALKDSENILLLHYLILTKCEQFFFHESPKGLLSAISLKQYTINFKEKDDP